MPDQNGEKQHEPTQHRREEARRQGQVAKSQDLDSAILLLLALMVLLMTGQGICDFFGQYMTKQLGGKAWLTFDVGSMVSHWHALVGELASQLLPMLFLMFLGAILVNIMQIGFIWNPERIAPDISNLSFLKGFKRIFSLQGSMRFLFGLFKMAIVLSVALVSLYDKSDTLLALSSLPVGRIAVFLINTILWTALKIAIALLLLALLEFAFQRWKHEQDLRMTTEELKEEMKNNDGNPEMKARRRQVQRELAKGRTSDAVPKADFVVTNPTELAIAIKYDPETMSTPIVVAKGAGVMARRIRELALEHGIPIIEKKPLARLLYKEVDVDQPIPSEQYAAVAEILAYVYQLKGKKMPGAA